MGCDIHLIVEQRNGRKWKEVDFAEFYDRSYITFAALADVRNRWEIVPVAPQKGFPKDCSVREEIESPETLWGWGGHTDRRPYANLGEHSFSWLSLAELNGYDWNQKVTESGYVGLDGYKEFLKKGQPTSYCQGVWGGKVVHISNEEMTQRVKNRKKSPQDQHLYTLVQWTTTLSEECVGFMEFLKELNNYADLNKIDPVDLRIVFGFDS